MREAIVDAAKKLLWELGYAKMSPGKVLAASGAGHGSLYHHFKSKRALAAEALAEVEAELMDVARRMFDPNKPPLARLRDYLLLQRDGLRGCRLGRLANETELLDDDELRMHLQRYFAAIHLHVRTAIDDACRLGDLPSRARGDDLAEAVVATVQGGFVISRATRDPQAVGRACRGAWRMIELLHRSLRA